MTRDNLYEWLFEPTFISSTQELRERWSIILLKELFPDLKMPTKKNDPNYSGEYDFWLDWLDEHKKSHGIRIEVKTSRAVDFKKPDEPLYIKALASGSKRPFDMNFQQIKIRCSEVFVWVAVWRDEIRFWVLNSKEVEKNKYYSKGQHRGNVGEGQLHLNRENISEFNKDKVKSTEIKAAIVNAYQRPKKAGKRGK